MNRRIARNPWIYRAAVGAALGAALAASLAGCSGGLFPERVASGIEPQSCGWNGSTAAPYFTASPTRGAAPLSVAFTADGPDVIEWLWSFGDGATSSLPAPTHIYAVAGEYTVKLTVVRPSGSGTVTQSYDKKRHIKVSGRPDLAIVGLTHAPDTGAAGDAIAFTVTVQNVGTAAAKPSNLTAQGAGKRSGAPVPRLEPGASVAVSVALGMTQSPETFTFTADGTKRVWEPDEANNVAQHTVTP